MPTQRSLPLPYRNRLYPKISKFSYFELITVYFCLFIFQNSILHIFFILIIIIQCSEMLLNVPGCFMSMFHVPCSMFHVPCSVFHVPCSVFRVPCSMFRVPCSMFRYPGFYNRPSRDQRSFKLKTVICHPRPQCYSFRMTFY